MHGYNLIYFPSLIVVREVMLESMQNQHIRIGCFLSEAEFVYGCCSETSIISRHSIHLLHRGRHGWRSASISTHTPSQLTIDWHWVGQKALLALFIGPNQWLIKSTPRRRCRRRPRARRILFFSRSRDSSTAQERSFSRMRRPVCAYNAISRLISLRCCGLLRVEIFLSRKGERRMLLFVFLPKSVENH
jgi:hypothetical protein